MNNFVAGSPFDLPPDLPPLPGPDATTEPHGPHLGSRLSAFVDDVLPADARDRVLVHLSGCGECRGEVEATRLLAARLAALPAPRMSAALTDRLLAMGDPGGPIPPRPGRMPGQPRSATLPRPGAGPVARATTDRPAAARPTGSRPAGRGSSAGPLRSQRHRGVRLAALAGAALSTVVVAVVGLSGAVGPESRTPVPVTQLTTNPTSFDDPIVQVLRTGRGGVAHGVQQPVAAPH